MIITEEMIRKVQARVDVSYEDAERYLRRAKGNIDRAVFLAKSNSHSSWDRFKEDVRRFLGNLFQYKLLVLRDKKTIINLPVVLIILFFMIIEGSLWNRLFIFFLAFLVSLIAECEIRIDKDISKENKKSYKKEYKQEYKQENKEENKEEMKEEKKYEDKRESNQLNKEAETITPPSTTEVDVKETVEVTKKEVYNNNEDDCYEIIIEE